MYAHLSLRSHVAKGSASFLAAAVTLAMAQEWATWALTQRKWWKLIPAYVLATFAMFESFQVWTRVERIAGWRR
jgi:hypothetical protein